MTAQATYAERYAPARRYCDADSHIMETFEWLADYADPDVRFNGVPCTTNPMGIKGGGEAGTIGACPAVVNAVIDALAPFGVRHIDMPLSPEKIWRAVADARHHPSQE